MSILRTLVGCSFVVCLSAASADAGQISFMASVPLQPTNFNSDLTVPMFDPGLGILQKVSFELGGHVEGSASFESLDTEPAVIDMQLAAEIQIQRPDNTILVIALPTVNTMDNASAFDGTIDFGGTSGKSYTGLMADDTEMSMTTAPADLVLFSGPGNITLPVVAIGASSGSGAGNLLLQFAASASADLTVTYEFIPEPATAGLLGLGIPFLAVRRRRRSA